MIFPFIVNYNLFEQIDSIFKDGAIRLNSEVHKDAMADEKSYSNKQDRQRRDLTQDQLDEFIKQLLNHSITPELCPAGTEERTNLNMKYCYKCPPGLFWSGVTRKCVSCPIGTYSLKDGTIGKCTPCAVGTTTAAVGAGNSSLCVDLCPPGHYSDNGLMQPVNCKACIKGYYADKLGTKNCVLCPSQTTTSDVGARDISSCQALCPAGFYSNDGLAPCTECPLNSYQPSAGLKACLKCPVGKTTLATGATQLSQCFVIYECSSNPCRNGGSCVDGNNRFICNCPPGWTGDMCEINIDECASKPCWSGATCVDQVNDFKCVCPHGFQGKLCNLNINECTQQPCYNGGQCIDTNGNFECSCLAGFGGQRCSINQDDCTAGICWNRGVCRDQVNGFKCLCATGFRGEQCAENIDDCEHNACQNGATCVDGINKYTCHCSPGFQGAKCETNIDECARRPCKRGSCTDAVNDYKCTCPSFYGGKDCSTTLSDCFNLYMVPNTVEDYVIYDPPRKIPPIAEITVRFSMKSNDRGLQSHYGTVISYGIQGRDSIFNIRTFPEQMLQVNGQDWLTGVDVTNNKWNSVCMTWRASDGRWRAYSGTSTSKLMQVSDESKAAVQVLSKARVIDGGGRFVIGQLDQGRGDDFGETSIFQGELSELNIWYKWDQCERSSTPDLAWPNLVYNGIMVTRTNKGMLRAGRKKDDRC
ncbi:sushi, von Willebrand factor type A, EGF and pentraxin domain-containing protein 1-like isoform X2 [Watersipora subatra]|uniref:sushi, von Willebrand factor type A, EGF and pentraxin domain-containing protein 1-like isoform X2 n=1 Tax=Watersipora subatra TaxID=2589382 RepID=UPI00355C4F67